MARELTVARVAGIAYAHPNAAKSHRPAFQSSLVSDEKRLLAETGATAHDRHDNLPFQEAWQGHLDHFVRH